MTAARLARSLYFQVLVAVGVGVAVGALRPEWGVALRPFGDGFIKLVKMLIVPIVFSTVVVGMARMSDLKKVGRVGVKAVVYFEVLTTVALAIGLVVGRVLAPGAGVHADPRTLDAQAVESYAQTARHFSVGEFLLGIIPRTVGDAFAKGDLLQVLLLSVFVGAAVSALGPRAERLTGVIEDVGQVFFRIVGMIMKLAPLGALGAMAFSVGKYGLGTLAALGKLVLAFYVTSLLFVLVVLGFVGWLVGFRIWRFLRYIRDEILIVLGTSSSESALPRLMTKLEAAGCSRSVVGLVVPMGYSFNLDGTSIYLTMATLFVAQALDTPLAFGQELGLLAVLLLTSKGAAAVTGGGFVTLAATLSATGKLPVAGLALLVGVDRFMSEARAITNLIGNGVATLAVARWEGELNRDRLTAALAAGPAPTAAPAGEHPAVGG